MSAEKFYNLQGRDPEKPVVYLEVRRAHGIDLVLHLQAGEQGVPMGDQLELRSCAAHSTFFHHLVLKSP